MTQIELFAGIGGFGLAGHWAGIESVAQVEIDPYCQKVLRKNFPNTLIHDDIHTFDGKPYAGTVDIISGGFPCQPYSTAGKRLGTADERHLWPEMLRVIREAAPRWVVGENVRGLASWSGGLVFEEVCADLEAIGYEVQPFILPAASVGAPHKRDRIWFVAHAGHSEQSGASVPIQEKNGSKKVQKSQQVVQPCISNIVFSNAKREGSQRKKPIREQAMFAKPDWSEGWPGVAARLCRMDDGIPGGMDRHRANRLKAIGNAIVPQVAYQIFKSIVEYESQNQTTHRGRRD